MTAAGCWAQHERRDGTFPCRQPVATNCAKCGRPTCEMHSYVREVAQGGRIVALAKRGTMIGRLCWECNSLTMKRHPVIALMERALETAKGKQND